MGLNLMSDSEIMVSRGFGISKIQASVTDRRVEGGEEDEMAIPMRIGEGFGTERSGQTTEISAGQSFEDLEAQRGQLSPAWRGRGRGRGRGKGRGREMGERF